MFVRSHHSLHSLAPHRSASLRFATLASLACSVHGLAHSLCSLPRGTVEILEYVFTLLSRFTGSNAFFIFTRNTPTITLALFTRYPKYVCLRFSLYLFYLIKKEKKCQLAVTKLSTVSPLLFLLLSADCFITFYLDSFSMRLVHPLSCFNLLYCREKNP